MSRLSLNRKFMDKTNMLHYNLLNCALSYAKNIVRNTDTARRHAMQITRN